MRGLALALVLGLSSAVFADVNSVKNLENKTVVDRASQVFEIYSLILDRVGLQNQAGHSMAAGVLTRCLGNRNVLDQIADFSNLMDTLKVSRNETISHGTKTKTPQMTYVAAVLTCKKMSRTAGDMVTLLEESYQALLHSDTNRGWLDWLPNVVVAADLLN
ncbi:hypothetical protein K2X33_06020 [bacterium]|nr:hypothetical protein [bacterium]